MFEAPGSGHPHGAEPISIAMGGAGLMGLAAADGSTAPRRHPDWIKARMPSGENYHDLKRLLRGLNLNTVCEEAHCPNIGECWDQRTATIMILGDTCTRACGFCDDQDRPADLVRRRRAAPGRRGARWPRARARRRHLGRARRPARRRRPHLRGDDPADAGRRVPGMGIEVLIPDFNGAEAPLRDVMAAGPDILNHNLETVRRLQKPVRKRARWDRTLWRPRASEELRGRVRPRGPHEELADGRARRDSGRADRSVRGPPRRSTSTS